MIYTAQPAQPHTPSLSPRAYHPTDIDQSIQSNNPPSQPGSVNTMRPTAPRDQVAGPDSGPEQPYPIHLSGPVIQGFGRGSKDVCMHSSRLITSDKTNRAKLGIPTANIPADGLDRYPDLETGVYYGVVALDSSSPAGSGILPAVLSIGYNPFYKNEVRSVVCCPSFLSSLFSDR